MRNFTKEDIEWLKANHSRLSLKECAAHLGRTLGAIRHKVSRLGFLKNGVHVEDHGKAFCKKCKKKKEIFGFTIEKSGRRHISCRECRAKQQKTYYENNRGEVNRRQNERHKRLAAADPNFALLRRLRGRLRKFVCKNQYKSSTKHTLGIDLDGFRAYLASKFLPGMNWENLSLWHLDHIKPCSYFDFSDPAQVAECFHYTNIQPLWAKDNLSKRNRFIG